MADYLSPTPYANPLTGLSNDMIQGLLGYMKDKQRTQQMQGMAGLLESTGIPQTVERAAYADSPKALLDALTNVNRANVPLLKAETADALMNIAPMVGPAARGAERAAMAAGRAGERYAEKVVPQIMERGGLPAQLLGDLSQGSVRPMDVWHGSPHGPFEKFDPTKIGSGEGAQAFSYGHYLGEARGTGETYRNQLVRAEKEQINKLLQSDDMASQIAGNTLNEYKNPSSAIGALKSSLTQSTTDIARAETNKAIKMLEDVNKDVGYLYKVDLPDEAIANMLDWDKPLSKQPNVMNALRLEAEQRIRANKLADIENDIRSSLPAQNIGDDYLSMFSEANVGINQDIQRQALEKLNKMDLNPLIDKELDNMKPVDMNWNMTGKEFYELLSKREGSPEKASGLLQRQGVPGTRYLDQQSRTPGGSDTSNFVVYPGGENFLTIKEINDKPLKQNLLD